MWKDVNFNLKIKKTCQKMEESLKEIVQTADLQTVIGIDCESFQFLNNTSDYHYQEDLILPVCDLLLINGTLNRLSFKNIIDILNKAQEVAKYILIILDHHNKIVNTDVQNGNHRGLNSFVYPFNLFTVRQIHACDGKMISLISKHSISNFKYNELHAMPSEKTVLIAILARNKAHTLRKYLQCIEQLDYDKDKITLYVNTNDNVDSTEKILKEWIHKHEDVYAKIIFESDNQQELDKDNSLPHQWNKVRCSVLGMIRNRSLQMALQQNCDYYFVIDCDNFVTNPYTLKDLISQNKPIVAPMLKCFPHNVFYSNFWCKRTSHWYYQNDPHYYKILNWNDQRNHPVPVVHCTYLVDSSVIPYLSYTEENTKENAALNYYEFSVFCRSAVKNNIQQYICNKSFYGYIYLPPDKFTLQQEMADIQTYIVGIN